jgi:hypothetical protein
MPLARCTLTMAEVARTSAAMFAAPERERVGLELECACGTSISRLRLLESRQ